MKRFLIVLLVVIFAVPCSFAYAGLFPSSEELFGKIMPNVSFAIDRDADSTETSDVGTIYKYQNFRDVDYSAFNDYLSNSYSVESYSVEGSQATITIQSGDTSIEFVYDRAAQTASVTYPNGVRIEAEKNTINNGNVLPHLTDLFGADELPSLSKALNRMADSSTAENGEIIEEFYNFTMEEYQGFSKYLLDFGCSVAENSVIDNVMTLTLKKGDTPFTFIYDYPANKATIKYASDVKREPGVTPTPIPTVAPAKNTAKPGYSKDDCLRIAKNYIKGTLKNPSSLQVHSSSHSFDGVEYTFHIDYSAQNGFGGYNRETYIVKVSSKTGHVSFAYST